MALKISDQWQDSDGNQRVMHRWCHGDVLAR